MIGEAIFKMGAESFRKYVSSWMIVCYRSVVRHPFLVGMIVFLFSMYRLFPLLFSVLLSASPVLVSTAVLLGTLLSFGQPDIPEIEKEPESQIHKLESKVMSGTEIVGRDESLVSEETNGSRIEVADRSFVDITKVNDDSLCVEAVNLIDDGLLQFGEEKVVLGSHYSPLQQSEDEHIVLESDKLWEGSADPLNSNSGLLWKGMEGSGGGDDDDDDDGSDSGSDIAESSSPDASMADIIPMLDELHPLLSEEQEAHQPSHVSHDGRDAVSEHSLESSDASSESNDVDDTGIVNHENLEVGDGEDEDKESKHDDKEDDTRSAITWTEDDQKNLMNLGTSELERNRRLENLIARRRARKTMRMQAEKNLIDLESADLPWNIPPISTSRNNPFDYDSNDNIPGSAPSVLSKRRNPFDLPYDSSEEKPDLVGDTFQQEFAVFQPKEPFFRRHESFNVGPSIFAASRSERQETKLKPYFVPERSFATFQRQFSGLSDSKASSVPDTESVSSDLENKDHIEEDEHASEIDEHVPDHVSHGRPYFVPEHVASDETGFSSFQRQLSEVSDSKVSSEPDTESISSADDLENKDHIDLSQEPDLISVEDHEHAFEIIEHVSEHVSLVNESFEEAEVSIESVTNQQELHSSGSSLSSLDEASEQIYNEKEGDEVAVGSVSETDYFLDRGSSIERSEIDVTSLLVEESQPNEPVYDLSPRSVTRNLSSSSISVDLHKDGSFLHTDDRNQSSSPAVPDNEEHVLAIDNISTSLTDKPILEVEDVVLDLDASEELEEVQVSSTNSHESFHQEDVMSQPLAGDPEELQDRDLEHGEVAPPSYEAQFTEVVHGETYETHSPTHGEDTSQLQKEFPLLDTSVNEPSEENPEVQVTSNSSDNLHIQEPDVVEVTDIETKAQEIPAYASDTHSIESSIDDVDEIKEIDEDLLVELDAVGDFSVSDLGSILDDMKEDLLASEDDLENKGIANEDSYNNDLESNLSEMKQYPHVLEHDLETNHSVDEDSYSRDLGSTSNEIKQEYSIETKCSGDEDSDSKDLGTTLDERKQDSRVSDHDLETTVSGDEESYSKVLGSTLDEMKQDPHASDHDLETKHSEEMKQDPHDLDHDLDTKHSEEMKEDTHDLDHDFETEHSEEIKQDPHALDHDLATEHSEEMKQDPHALDHDLETEHSEEMKQDTHALDHDLETKHSEDEDSYSKDATLDEMKPSPHASDYDLETKHSEDKDSYSTDATFDVMKPNPHDSIHDLETKQSEDEDSYSKDATFDEMKPNPHDSSHDLETKHSGDEDSYSKDATLDEMKQDPHALDHDLETNHFIDEDSSSKDLDSTFTDMKQGTHALEHRLETFYSVDDNVYSKHVESTSNEMKHDLQDSDQDLETNHSGETKIKMDEEVMKSQNENDISNTKVEGAFQADASKSMLTSDSSEVVLPQETESTTSLANTTSATTVNHGTENASSTSNTDKE
ncbi:hypothetical protein L1987_41294 [Smallanthus sonchifolius]|uniref:Uncharacterized protein n=1 Tax=Smallanthus sonchifolius TaxID=185202 RepID=A0ACB9GVG5_9ASTR|nr:hypothetical protein L1987_41294 [Smallanthus sonchifolius]